MDINGDNLAWTTGGEDAFYKIPPHDYCELEDLSHGELVALVRDTVDWMVAHNKRQQEMHEEVMQMHDALDKKVDAINELV